MYSRTLWEQVVRFVFMDEKHHELHEAREAAPNRPLPPELTGVELHEWGSLSKAPLRIIFWSFEGGALDKVPLVTHYGYLRILV